MIKDNINLYENYEQIYLKCYCCGKKGHQLINCNLIHYEPDKEKILKSYFFPQFHVERRNFLRKSKKQSRIIINNYEKSISNEIHSSIDSNSSSDEAFSRPFKKLKTLISANFSHVINTNKFRSSNNFTNVKMSKLALIMEKLESEINKLKKYGLKNQEEDYLEFDMYKNFLEYFPHNNLINIVIEYNRIKEVNLIIDHNSLYYTLNLKRRLSILNSKKVNRSFSNNNSIDKITSSLKKLKSKRAFSIFAESKKKNF